MGFNVTVTPQVQEVEISATVQAYEVQVTANQDLVDYVNEAKQSADEAEASAILADNSADNALASATSATASASSASASASSASSSASTATTQAGIATTKANEASQSASNALASEQASAISEGNALASEQAASTSEGLALISEQNALASEQASALSASNALSSANSASASASTATTQAGIATTQAGIATTQAGNALTSANNAAASASAAAQVGTSTLLTGFSVGSNTSILATDSILQAFNKTQGQINARVSGTGAAGQVAFWSGASAQTGDAGLTYNSNELSISNTLGGSIKLINTSDLSGNGSIFMSTFGRLNIISSQTIDIFNVNTVATARFTSISGNPRVFIGGNSNAAATLEVGGTARVRNDVSLATVSGNVQIGTTTDAGFRLDVNGTARVTGAFRVDSLTNATGNFITTSATGVLQQRTAAQTLGDIGGIGGTIASGQVAFATGANTVGGDDGLFWDNTNKRLGIGTNAPNATLTLAENSIFLWRGGANQGFSAVSSRINVLFAGIVSHRFRATGLSLGSATDPTTTLDVYGNGRIRDGVSLAYTSGNVQIGTTTDSGFRLDVNGTARVQSTLKVGAATAQNGSAVLDIESTTRGFLPPRMTTAQRDAIASPAQGLQIFNTTTTKTETYDGTTWQAHW
jgi:hypothetical protein